MANKREDYIDGHLMDPDLIGIRVYKGYRHHPPKYKIKEKIRLIEKQVSFLESIKKIIDTDVRMYAVYGNEGGERQSQSEKLTDIIMFYLGTLQNLYLEEAERSIPIFVKGVCSIKSGGVIKSIYVNKFIENLHKEWEEREVEEERKSSRDKRSEGSPQVKKGTYDAFVEQI